MLQERYNKHVTGKDHDILVQNTNIEIQTLEKFDIRLFDENFIFTACDDSNLALSMFHSLQVFYV